MRHDHQASERCDGCSDWPRYAIELAIHLQRLDAVTMSLSDDITANTTTLERNNAILADVKAAVDTLRGAVDPAIVARFDAAVAGEGAAVQALAADVNVDQTPPVEPAAPEAPVEAPVEAPAPDAPAV